MAAYAISVLEVVQDFCGRNGLPVPSAVFGSTDTAVIQYRTLLKQLNRELAQFNWQQITVRATFVTIAAEDQGDLDLIIGSGVGFPYDAIAQMSVWDETLRRPVFGPVGDASWEMLKAFVNTGPLYQYKIFQDHFFINPAPPAGDTIGMVIKLKSVIVNAGGAPLLNPNADTCAFIVPPVVVDKGFDYMWKRQKGEAWEDLFNEYMGLIAKNIVKDANKPILFLDQSYQNLVPGIWVPAGNWP